MPRIVLTATHWGWYFVRSDDFLGRIFMKGQHFEDGCLSRVLPLLDEIPERDIVDVGANFGCHTVPYANRSQAAVYTFEPQAIVYDLLIRNIELNGCRNVVPYRFALGHQDRIATTLGGSYELHGREQTLNDPHPVHNYGGIGLGRGTEEVVMMTLDWYRLDNVGLIKIDVEGAEPLVVFGAAHTISRCKPYVVFEHHTATGRGVFEARWRELCEMYSLPAAKETSIFDLLTVEFSYAEIQRLDENNYLAVP